MSKLGELYKQAHDLVLKKYQENQEDAWKVNAIFRSRLGEKGHDSVMFAFVKDIETQVDELLKSIPVVDSDKTSLNKKKLEVSAVVQPTQPH